MGAATTSLIAVALALLCLVLAFCRPRTIADRSGASTDLDLPHVSVVIPARNEAATLPTLLASLARSDVAPHEIVVVDDASDDPTAAVARANGARVIAAPPLPSGWAGKPWACCVGAAASSGDILLFLDADVTLAPSAIASLLRHHAQVGGLTSVQPYHIVEQPYEHASAFFNASAVLGSGAFGVRPPVPMQLAYGPCLMTSRTDYERVGGHAAVRASVVEDIDLARLYAGADLPVRCWLGGDLVRFRMYPDGVRALLQGWTKNIAAGARRAAPAPTVIAVAWIACLASVAAATASASVRWAAGDGAPVAVWCAYAIAAAQVWWVLRRIGSFRWWASAAYPVGLAVFLAVFARSAVVLATGRPVRWRGRSLPSSPTISSPPVGRP